MKIEKFGVGTADDLNKFLFIFVGDDAHIVPSATDKERTLSGRMWASAPTRIWD